MENMLYWLVGGSSAPARQRNSLATLPSMASIILYPAIAVLLYDQEVVTHFKYYIKWVTTSWTYSITQRPT